MNRIGGIIVIHKLKGYL